MFPVGLYNPFKPADLTGLLCWLDASQLTLSDGAAVSSWTDVSGNGRHATQATAGNRPVFKTGVFKTRNAIRFNRTRPDYLGLAAMAGGTYFAVAKYDFSPFQDFDGLFTTNRIHGIGNAAVDSFYPPELANISVRINGASTLIPPNGIQTPFLFQSEDTAIENAASQIGLDRGITSRGWAGDVAEFVAYDRVLGTNERQRVEHYFRSKYALY